MTVISGLLHDVPFFVCLFVCLLVGWLVGCYRLITVSKDCVASKIIFALKKKKEERKKSEGGGGGGEFVTL